MRTHNCGQLRINNVGEDITLSGWVQRIRDKGGMLWIDLRDRYGITQLMFQEGETSDSLLEKVRTLGREYVIQVKGEVIERFSKNENILLMHTYMEAGHGGASVRFDALKEIARDYSFILDLEGINQ